MSEPARPARTPARVLGSLPETFYRLVPAFDSLRSYGPRTFAADSMAGLTVAAVAVPQAMAYAQIAGIPPQYGLYTAIVMTGVGALFDSSKHLINGPTNAISIAVLSALVTFGEGDRLQAAVLLALLVGTVQLGITLLRLGDLTRFISHSVIIGFTLGAAVLLVLDQFKNLLGLKAVGGGEDHFLYRFWQTLTHAEETHVATLLISLGTMAVALGIRHVNRRFRVPLPEFLIALTGMAALVWALELDRKGVAIVGTIPARLPSFEWPTVRWAWVHTLSGSGLAIALLGLLEAIAMAKAIAAQTRQKLDINQQCLSEALANLAGSAFQCFPGSGSLTRSIINKEAGAKTQWSGVISAIAVALTVVLLAPYAYYIPRSGLAGILLLSAWRLVDWPQLGYYFRTTRFDAIIVAATAISAVAISVEFCVLIGVFLSFLLYVPRAARVHLTELVVSSDRVIRERIPADPRCSVIGIYSLEGELFFGAAPELEQHFEAIEQAAEAGLRVVVLRMKRARNPDAVCLQLLDHFIERMRLRGVVVILCAIRPDLMKVLESGRVLERLGAQYVFVFQETGAIWSSTLEAVRFAYEIVGDNVCPICPRHKTLEDREGWTFMI
jgi:SulP family sulfate permease